MPRSASQTGELPKKIYFIKTEYYCYGPYSKRPTSQFKEHGGEIIEFEINDMWGSIIYVGPESKQ